MLIVFHVIIALGGILLSSWTLLAPSRLKFRLTYGAVGLTVISGTGLIITKSAHILATCISGLTYIGVVSVILAAAHWRLARQSQD